MKYIALVCAVLLAGCVHEIPKSTAPQHHYVAKPKAAPVAPPVVVAPAPQVETPKQKTFRRRWLRLFFRDRATK
jgi:hypothetical protein